MSKLGAVSATAGVGGTGAVGVGGAYLAGAFGSSGEYGGRYVSPTIDGLEKSSGGCIDHTFPYWYIPKTTLPSMSSSDVIFDDTSNETGGCLVFNWKKKNKDKNWLGSNLRFVWTFVKGTSGFVAYLSGSVKENNTIKFDGVVYGMKKENGWWKATHKVEARDKTVSDRTKHFPRLGDEDQDKFPHKSVGNVYWDFLKDDGSGVKDLGEGESDYKYGRWKWIGRKSSDTTLDNWSANLVSWWKNIFGNGNGETADAWIMDTKGSWEKY